MSDRSKSGMGGGKAKKAGGKSHSKPHSIHIRRADSGGYVATHHHKAAPGEVAPDPTEHVIPDSDQLAQHVQNEMGDQPPAGGMAPAAAPAAGAGPAAPPMGM